MCVSVPYPYILKIGQSPKLYVLDRKNSREILLAINLRGDPIAWNPSGTILFINEVAAPIVRNPSIFINEISNPHQPNLKTALYVITCK
jgi:hypothetical protein